MRPAGPLLLDFHAGDGSRPKTQRYGGLPFIAASLICCVTWLA
jgi:hypothetical protein